MEEPFREFSRGRGLGSEASPYSPASAQLLVKSRPRWNFERARSRLDGEPPPAGLPALWILCTSVLPPSISSHCYDVSDKCQV